MTVQQSKRSSARPWMLVEPEDYAARVEAYEAEGMTTSDAQATVDADIMREYREGRQP